MQWDTKRLEWGGHLKKCTCLQCKHNIWGLNHEASSTYPGHLFTFWVFAPSNCNHALSPDSVYQRVKSTKMNKLLCWTSSKNFCTPTISQMLKARTVWRPIHSWKLFLTSTEPLFHNFNPMNRGIVILENVCANRDWKIHRWIGGSFIHSGSQLTSFYCCIILLSLDLTNSRNPSSYNTATRELYSGQYAWLIRCSWVAFVTQVRPSLWHKVKLDSSDLMTIAPQSSLHAP